MEDLTEEEHKSLQAKVESLESIVRMLELKAKNASDHVFRLEEKENEMRKEFTKVHDRYTELLKVHMDHVERTRGLLGSDRLEVAGLSSRGQSGLNSWNLNVNLTPPQMNRSTGPLSFGFASLENATTLNPTNSKFYSNPSADLVQATVNEDVSILTSSTPNALQTELVICFHLTTKYLIFFLLKRNFFFIFRRIWSEKKLPVIVSLRLRRCVTGG